VQAIKEIYYRILENADYYGILALLFVTIFIFVMAVAYLLRNRQASARSRLSKLVKGPVPAKQQSDRDTFLGQKQDTLASRISKPIHKLSSLDKRSVRQQIQLRLVRAGYRSDQAIYNYLAAKIICPIVYIGIFLFTQMVYKFQMEMVFSVLMLLVFGFFTPSLWVFLMTKTRQEKIFKGLPDALDLMVVCVESGLGIDMTFKRVGEEIRPICKELSDEFTLTNLEIRAGISREDAFKNMHTRTALTEVNSLMTVLTQTSRFGTSLAKSLRVHADSLRVKRRQIAEETAAKSAVKLVFPLVLFIFPAIFVVLVGPGALKIIKYLIPVLSGGG